MRLARSLFAVVPVLLFAACGTSKGGFSGDEPGTKDAGAADGDPIGNGDDSGTFGTGDGGKKDEIPQLPSGQTKDPVSCAEAEQQKSYVGCDYWPTVVANNVWSNFDFAAVVANAGATAANITITGPNNFSVTRSVAPGSLEKFYLPWVRNLKGPDTDSCGTATPMTASVYESGGAYHLVSSSPVTVYQFNALEYKGEGGSGNWATCPGSTQDCVQNGQTFRNGCFSFSNDASLLLPSTAMTGNYRITGQRGWTEKAGILQVPTHILGGYFAVTATQDNTDVTVTLSAGGKVLAGGSKIAATNGGGTLTFKLDKAGDVAEIVGDKGESFDFGGSLVKATKPVQVISGVPCINQPFGQTACDHIEESVFPAETLGRRYVVTVPTGPKGQKVGHIVRFFGNQDATRLQYQPSKPAGCPNTLNAGMVVECGRVDEDFEVVADKEVGIASFMLGGSVVDPAPLLPPPDFRSKGDPSQTLVTAVEQYRTSYVFLAPNDYDVSYVDIVGTQDAKVVLDGTAISAPFTAIGSRGLGVYRVKLGTGKEGAHTITSEKAVGIQVMGYGAYTSYQYPGGLDLRRIAPPPR